MSLSSPSNDIGQGEHGSQDGSAGNAPVERRRHQIGRSFAVLHADDGRGTNHERHRGQQSVRRAQEKNEDEEENVVHLVAIEDDEDERRSGQGADQTRAGGEEAMDATGDRAPEEIAQVERADDERRTPPARLVLVEPTGRAGAARDARPEEQTDEQNVELNEQMNLQDLTQRPEGQLNGFVRSADRQDGRGEILLLFVQSSRHGRNLDQREVLPDGEATQDDQ